MLRKVIIISFRKIIRSAQAAAKARLHHLRTIVFSKLLLSLDINDAKDTQEIIHIKRHYKRIINEKRV